jgi:FG-GAP-like repeat/WD40-like Beta Propeller Repeat
MGIQASGLIDGNGVNDVFTYTPAAPALTLVSAAAFLPAPIPGNSFTTSVSGDGSYSVFTSTGTNLVADQINPHSAATVNVFLFDKNTNTVQLVNHVSGLPTTSGDGGLNYKGQPDYQAPIAALQPVLSADGSVVAFTSYDNNLLPGEAESEPNPNEFPWETLNYSCVYLYNTQTGQITLVNHAAGTPNTIGDYASSPAVSDNGQYVAYVYDGAGSEPVVGVGPADQGVGAIALYNSLTDTTTRITSLNAQNTGSASDPSISGDGRFVTYLNQGNVYVFDNTTGQTTLVSHDVNSSTTPARAASTDAVISDDGSTIAFVSSATDLVTGQAPSSFTNVFRYANNGSGAISLVSGVACSLTVGGNGNSDSPAIDGNGSYIAFRSDATNILSGQTGATSNIFEFNTQAHTQALVSAQAGSSTIAAGGSSEPVIDGDGHLVSYTSTAGNLVPGQSGPVGVENVFIWLRQTGANILASGQNGSPTLTGNADSDDPVLTRDSFPVFSSVATNLLPGVGGTSVAYLNTLVQLVLSNNLLADQSPAGTTVGNLGITGSLYAGAYLPPAYSLPAGNDNAAFRLGSNANGETLVTFVATNYASQSSYQVNVHVDIGFGDESALFPVVVAAPSPPRPVADLIGQENGVWWLSASNGSAFLPPGGSVNFGSAAANSAAAAWVDVQVGDFDGTSAGELAGRVAQTGQWWVAVPNGTGGFTTTVWANWAPLAWQHVLVGDFSGDGKTDLAAMEPDNGTWWVARSTGNGFATSSWANWAPLNWLHVVAGDFSGDGKTDLAAMEPDNGVWWVGVSTGNGFATSAWGRWTPDYSLLTWDVVVGDFNGDRQTDLAGFDEQGGNWWVAASTGASFVTSLWAHWTADSAAATWQDWRVGDFQGNGKDQIAGFLVGSTSKNGQWTVFYANPTGTGFYGQVWATWYAVPGQVDWVNVVVGDFNGDGQTDIAARLAQSGEWWVNLSSGVSFVSQRWTIWSPAVNWVNVDSGRFT